ncbi:MAG: ATP synthase F1 subunit delta [Bacteroidota bacterium]
MTESKVARRYAKSLLGLATEKNITEKVFSDMQLISTACHQSHELALLMKNPIINTDKKEAVIKGVFSGKVDNVTLSFMDLMTKKGREGHLMDIAQEYINIYKESIGVKVAHVTTATPMDASTREQVLEIIKKMKGNKIELVETVNKNIIGGFVLRINDEQYDASILKKLRQLKNEFDDNAYVKEY